jgi:diguanylate cyclase (GGDEF)-like protein/PAS domain S-box-containing protein
MISGSGLPDSIGRRANSAFGAQFAALMQRWRQQGSGGDDFGFGNYLVLVADDEELVADATKQVLETRLGCRVDIVGSGDAVLEYLEAKTADVLIADMIMPGLNGLELIKTVQRRWPGTDVIVITGHSEDFPFVDVVHAGAKDFIGKPYPSAELEAKLLRLLGERALMEARVVAESKYRSVFDLNTNGMVLLDETTRGINDVNAAFCGLSGRTREQLLSTPFADLLDPFERGRFEQGLSLCAPLEQGTLGDLIVVRPDGQEISLDISMTFIQAGMERIVCLSLKDTTEKRQLEENLVEAAQMDQLTGLLNKRSFATEVEAAVTRTCTDGSVLSMLFIDVDDFKSCNDKHGHPVGDQVLRTIGQIINKNTRRGQDRGFRYGGDEFAVVLVGADTQVALSIGGRIRVDLEHAENFGTSLSIGIAECKPGMTGDDLMRHADDALYRAKSLGRNTICLA